MTDRPEDVTELVRPYVKAHEPPADEERPTAIQPAIVVPPPPPPSPSLPSKNPAPHWALRLLVLVIGVAVALAIVAYFVRGGGSHDDSRRGPSASLPAINAPVPTGGAAAPISAKPSVTPSRSASSSASVSPSASISSSAASIPPSRQPTLAPPPAGARTGRISSAGGRCLALGGLLGIDGSPIETVSCGGGTSQKFTLATDGTLQVANRCAAASGDGSVRSDGCGGTGDSGQWRSGPNGSLVNPSSGRCLTDPGTSGATTSVSACTGKDDQRWSLP
jgi:hypothetical protein